MKIKNKTSYPYPIWGWKDDFKTTIDEDDAIITEVSDKDSFIYKLELKAKNEDIEALVKKGVATHACIAFCPYTMYHEVFKPDGNDFLITIPRREVFKKVELEWVILSTTEIDNFESDTLNEDYVGHAQYPKGAVLAYITSFELNAELSGELRTLDEVFSVVKSDSDSIEYDFDKSKIKIKLPKALLSVFNDYGAKYPSTMHSTIVMHALTLAISKLHEYYDDDDKDWVVIIKQFIDVMDSEEIPTTEEASENGYTFEQCFQIADYILQSPMVRMFEEIKTLEEQAEQLVSAE